MKECKICGEETETTYCPEHEKDMKELNRYVAQGHTRHCACRIVWGDGLSDGCECGLVKAPGEGK